MADKKVIKQTGENPFAMIDSTISINIASDSQQSEVMKKYHRELKNDLQDTKQKIGGLKGHLTYLINKGFEKIRDNIGIDIALNMNTLQRGGSHAPPLSPFLIKRNASVSFQAHKMNNLTWMHIYGDVLTGKTHYLHLLAEELNDAKCFWIKCKNLDSEQTVMTIKLTLADILKIKITNEIEWFEKVTEKLGNSSVLIIDDLPSFQTNDVLYENLISLYLACFKHGVKILSSSSVTLTQSLINILRKETVNSIQMPLFSNDDVVELIQLKNKSINNAQNLANWIGAVTKYNPALIMACIDYIDSKNWNITSEVFNNIQNGFYSLELSREIRNLLLNDIPDNETKELLYRLSIIGNDFDNRYVEKISAIYPPVIHPYDKLHLLEGYWLQRTREGYRISPLIDCIGVNNLPENLVKEIHSRIAQILSQSKVLSPLDFVKLFSHLLQAKEFNNAAHIFFTALTELNKSELEKDYWGISSIWYDIPLPTEINKELQLLIRAKQIITCLKFKKDVTYLINDLNSIDNNNEFIGAIYLMLAFELLDYNVDLSISYLERFYSLDKSEFLEDIFKESFEQFIWFYPIRLKGNINSTKRILEIIDNMSDQEIKKLFNSDISHDGAMLLADNVWLEESKKGNDLINWNNCVELLEKMKDIGVSKNNAILYSCAVRALIIVKFEYLNNEDQALSLYSDALKFAHHNCDSLFLLHAILGKQYIYKKNYKEARGYLLLALKVKSTKFQFERIDALVYVAKCHESINPKKAIRQLKIAYEISNKLEHSNEFINIKLLGELGIIYFNEKLYAESYNCFKEALIALKKPQERNDYWKSLIVVFGHVLGYVSSIIRSGVPPKETGEKEHYTKPSLAMFWTDNDIRHEYYDTVKELHLNTLMGFIAGDINEYEDEFFWLNITWQELKNNHLSGTLSMLTKKDLVPHLILRNEFVEAIDIGIEASVELVASMYGNPEEKNILESLDIKAILNDSEKLSKAVELSIGYVFIPIFIFLSEQKLIKKDIPDEQIKKIIKGIEVNKAKYSNTKAFDNIMKVFRMTFIEMPEEKEYLNGTNEYSSNQKLLFYLAFSLVASKRDALDVHIKVVEYLYDFYQRESFTFMKIITPFFKNFWMYSYIQCRYDFHNTEVIDSKLNDLLIEDNKNTVKHILSLMNVSMKLPIPEKILKFLN